MFKKIKPTVLIAHDLLASYVQPGAVAVDATVGNGHDTLFLAQLVGQAGRVYGFDIQEEAVKKTAELLAQNGFTDTVRLFQAGHECLFDYVTEPVDAIVFNLGYLPGGDHNIVTGADSTTKAVRDGLALLKPGGIACLIVYTGHPGGPEEKEALGAFMQTLNKNEFCAARLDFLNRRNAPYLIIIEKSLV
ncbi:MAG: class I SAM-dependent methyltransferase [Eubacteriales bacterium]